MTLSGRHAELIRAQGRAIAASKSALPPAEKGDEPVTLFKHPVSNEEQSKGEDKQSKSFPIGTVMSGLLQHGGVYSLMDTEIMAKRFEGMMMHLAAGNSSSAMMADMRAAMNAAQTVPTYFFYHLVDNPYPLHSQLVSYLSYPARHLRSPIDGPGPGHASAPPYDSPGQTYSQVNTPSQAVPAAATFIGQFIDHDLTLNAMNLFDAQGQPGIRDMASPLIDLDSVYGPRLDDKAVKTRVIPIVDDMFCLDPISGLNPQAYDVCREIDKDTGEYKALIGDKRNDENQLILQVHIAAMRLHNYFVDHHKALPEGERFKAAKRDTILNWQAMVATYYLPLIARHEAIEAVKSRLFGSLRRVPDTPPLCHRPGLTVCGGTMLGMPHEFAIGFRFGHSQLRSEYRLKEGGDFIRLFDPLAPATFGGASPDDLTGGKKLVANHVISWKHFTNPCCQSSNLIDRQVNEVVFALPESTIPDELKLVNNLAARNLIRSDKVNLCAGEDLFACYMQCYPELNLQALKKEDVEPRDNYQILFQLNPNNHSDIEDKVFRTPLWYYLLCEAETERSRRQEKENEQGFGKLGMVGSLLVAEVILSGIRYAKLTVPTRYDAPMDICVSQHPNDDEPCSIFLEPTWANKLSSWNTADQPLVSFLQIADWGTSVVPPKCSL